jgi:beta-glucosidase
VRARTRLNERDARIIPDGVLNVCVLNACPLLSTLLARTFKFGSATAAYQVEGGLHDCNWSMWEERKTRPDGGATVDGHARAGLACDHWNKFEADLECMKQLGIRMYRFSVEWSRVEPREGAFDEAAMERYVSWCRLLRGAGIEPMVTLHHFTEPAWFVAKGGWEKRANVDCFAKFAEFAVTRLAQHCSHWTTINELNGYAVCGWLAGVHPPGKSDQLFTMLAVIRHLLVAHTRASSAIRAASSTLRQSPRIAMPLSYVWFTTKSSWDPLALLVALFLNLVFNFVLTDPLHTGRFPLFPIPFHAAACLCGWRTDLQALRGTTNCIGLNHYYRTVVTFGRTNSTRRASATDLFINLPLGLCLSASTVDGFEKTAMGWDLTPSSMERVLRAVWERYHVPIYITESGVAEDGDDARARYIGAVLGILARLRAEGVSVQSYLVWTLLDNFEWAEGYRPRFGLLHTDFDTLKRTERPNTGAMLRSCFGTT